MGLHAPWKVETVSPGLVSVTMHAMAKVAKPGRLTDATKRLRLPKFISLRSCFRGELCSQSFVGHDLARHKSKGTGGPKSHPEPTASTEANQIAA